MRMERKRPIQEIRKVKPVGFNDELQVNGKTDREDKGNNVVLSLRDWEN